MKRILKPLTLAAALTAGAMAQAQDADVDLGQSTGDQPGAPYVAEVMGDWEKRCVRNPEGEDPCNLQQVLSDQSGQPMGELSISRLPDGQPAQAGAVFVAPLETLLTQQIRISVDGAEPKVYPFRFCTQVGCIAQLGFTAEEVGTFKSGNAATITVVPAAAPNQQINLEVSLAGFTAAFDSLAVPPAPAGQGTPTIQSPLAQ